MKILLIGATGQLGADLIRNNPGHLIIAPPRTALDIERVDMISSVLRDTQPELVVNTAAFHNVPLCEEQPERAFRVNCVAVRDLALACRAREVRLVTFSSDYVFGGDKRSPYTELDCPAPLQVYGITRLAGERAALAVAPEHAIIVRTSGLYGLSGATSKGGNFVDKRVADARREAPLTMACDQTVGPTSTDDLSRAVFELIDKPALGRGIFHLVNEGECTWYEFTKAIYDILGLKVELRPVDSGGRSGTVRRPLYSVLANTRARALSIRLPPWPDALRRYLKNKYSSL